MEKRRTQFKKLRGIAAAVIILTIFIYWQNNSLVVTEMAFQSDLIPETFNDFRIVQISDLHNKRFGLEQSHLISRVKSQKPDLIVITGDLIDRRKYNLEISMQFIRGAVEIAPVYYVSGNHEAWSGKYPEIVRRLTEAGVMICDDIVHELSKGSDKIEILGLADPDFLTSDYMEGTDVSKMAALLSQWADDDGFKILLSHRPELFDLYRENGINLIFSGHAHGGQFRIPFVGGVIAPDQGLFPRYTSGSYTEGKSTMVVSRGLGNSIIPVRIFNRPEIVVVNLRRFD